jgi:hypothetical protein
MREPVPAARYAELLTGPIDLRTVYLQRRNEIIHPQKISPQLMSDIH